MYKNEKGHFCGLSFAEWFVQEPDMELQNVYFESNAFAILATICLPAPKNIRWLKNEMKLKKVQKKAWAWAGSHIIWQE